MEITSIISGRIHQPLLMPTPSLDTLIVKGNTLAIEPQSTLDFLYQFFYPNMTQFPIADITASVDLDGVRNKKMMRADPALLHADLATLLFFDSQKFSIKRRDVDAVFSILNPFLKEDGLHLVSGENNSRWYVELNLKKTENNLITSTPKSANGKDVGLFFPKGKDSDYWIRLSNELQMLLHAYSENSHSKYKGKSFLNSVWFWGSGELSEDVNQIKAPPFDIVVSDDVNAIGLAKLAGVEHENIPEDFDGWLQKQNKNKKILLVLSTGDLAISESEKFNVWLAEQDEKIYRPILFLMKKNVVKKLHIKTDDVHCAVKKNHLFRFWRKAKNQLKN